MEVVSGQDAPARPQMTGVLKPVTEKKTHNETWEDLGLIWGAAEMQGWRPSMEDDYVATRGFGKESGFAGTGLFGVFDGHGGKGVASFCAKHLPKAVAKGQASASADAMLKSFQLLDESLADAAKSLPSSDGAHPDRVGCTAAACLVRHNELVVANAGDSRLVLSRNGRAIDLSTDHKPGQPEEAQRIAAAGGFVVAQQFGTHVIHRVNGELSLSRAIGDLRYKKDASRGHADQMVTCVPEVRTYARQSDQEFLVIACDGIWDVLSSQDVVNRVHQHLPALRSHDLRPSDVISMILDECLATNPHTSFGIGGDNMTMLLILFEERAVEGITERLSNFFTGYVLSAGKHPAGGSSPQKNPLCNGCKS